MSVNTVSTSNLLVSPATADGYQVGGAATSLIGFYGATPVAQPTSSGEAAVTTTAATTSTPYGFSTSTQANAIVTLVNQLRADLVTLGIIKGS